ncbi:polysaccharide export outer membrane protein [Xylanibacter ruminicola]|uniref:Polysaccharide export outer membrane protein n=1 Tax=Xylanibacter ruminicola TaxID=839 RepID=A0A1M7FJB2_XYLRU|nr:polysaccharide biosynthesis/export family protein [Xylanibacter ruminicola]SHM03878.1 polysaccharide export outer membrane protein [Xylanibacter ruminicola]
MSSLIKYFLLLVVLLSTFSCGSYRSVPYFQNSADFDGSNGPGHYDLKIKPKDELTIFVFSGNDEEAVSIFNIREPRELSNNNNRISVSGSSKRHLYLVDNDGNINFPILGSIHVEGLTLDSINSKIKQLVSPYLQPEADCVVNTYIENYVITVMGEVKTPNTFTMSRPEVTVLEALAMAGDMTIYGKRDNVKILRELPDGSYEVHELDMRDANILNSPYYYLQQRDIVYVEPNEAMVQESKIGRTTQLWIRGAAITISLGSLLFRVLQ